MRRVFAIGETVLDIMFKNNIPVSAKPGGSMLNVAVTLGRLNESVYFISEYGTDQVGDLIDDFLVANGVNTKFINRYSEGKSALALAFLDKNQNAAYSFYKSYPKDRLSIEMPDISQGDILMFGSFFGIAPEIRPDLLKILTNARESGALVIYDPNFRKPHLNELDELLPYIKENIQIADIIKGSDEDFKLIFGANSALEAFEYISDKRKILIYTAGKDGATLVFENQIIQIAAKQIETVSTVGAGDNFNAGVAFGLLKNDVTLRNIFSISTLKWKEIVKCGIDFATEVCLSYDNYISSDYAKNYYLKN